jgi:GAF domain-containing protein
VIAIENTRLFEAEQASKRELQESLEYQTATSEVLNVISRSPSRVQPVLDTIAQTAGRLCQAENTAIWRIAGDVFQLAAHTTNDATLAKYLAENPLPTGPASLVGRVVLAQRTIHIPDVLADPVLSTRPHWLRGEARTALGVPLLRDGVPSGVITLTRHTVRPFTDKQIDLVATFADQAVIAIENTRLFEEVQTRTRELSESLEYQTATSEVLDVISRSPAEVQPVLDSIVRTAAQLCQADHAHVFRLRDGKYHLAAHNQKDPHIVEYLANNPIGLDQLGSVTARAARVLRTVHVPDAMQDPEYGHGPLTFSNDRTVLSVPLLRDRAALGVVTVGRHMPRPFTRKEIELVETFADQAVIAIENTRLFEEVQARNRDLTALGEVGRAVSSTLDLKVVLKTIVDRAVALSGTDAGSIFYYRDDIGKFELGETVGLDADLVERTRKLDIAAGQTGLGEAIAKRQPLQIPDITKRPSNALRDAAIEAGLRAALVVPLLSADAPLGALVLQRRRTGEFSPSVVNLMQSFADQSAIALENARLFEEIAQKSRELEIASQHKSQFVANMSHELRTPLAAMLGYAELLQEGIYGAPPEKFLPILMRIRSNGKHLLGLINTVLDISKIEAGQFKLNLAEYALGSIVDTVMGATESLAATKKLAFKTEVAKGLPYGLGDEQRLTQVLLNLVGNAIKFTDAGEVRITAGAQNGHFALSVSDTGPGIPPEERERIFEKFRQIDGSNTRQGRYGARSRHRQRDRRDARRAHLGRVDAW